MLNTLLSFAFSNHSPFCYIRYESIIATLCENLDSLDEPDAPAAMIWIVGEYAERIDNADELLESFLEGFHDESTQVSSHLYLNVLDVLGTTSGKVKVRQFHVCEFIYTYSMFIFLPKRGDLFQLC